MKLFILISALVVVASASLSKHFSDDEVTAQFEKFKLDNSRIYASAAEETKRKAIFASNLDFIFTHNEEHLRGLHSFTVGVTPFADQTRQTLPESVDWVAKGVVSPVQNQGQLGASWAFSSVAAVESSHAIQTGHLVKLSEAQLEDCCSPYNGTSGPYDNIFQCVIKLGGIDTEVSYPLPQGKCAYNPATRGTGVYIYVDIPFGSEYDLQLNTALGGPVAVLIDASQQSFMLYTGGVYYEPACSSTVLDMAVAVVGYGVDAQSGAAFWKVKNSWGTGWGESGYIRMARNRNNNCGIASAAVIPFDSK
ncbi:hypothetical protein TYRP_011062 [Tyrophagus putrescentiae]|nr:hypothetical protein TYRP_011062 [Tyrophagus putrescentiae]